MSEVLIILIFSLVYSVFSTFLNVFLEQKEEIKKISKKIEKFLKNNQPNKVYESYLNLFKITLKYTLLNLFVGFLIFLTLFSFLKNFEVEIPFVSLKIGWFIIYVFFVFVFSLTLKYLFKLFLKIWKEKR